MEHTSILIEKNKIMFLLLCLWTLAVSGLHLETRHKTDGAENKIEDLPECQRREVMNEFNQVLDSPNFAASPADKEDLEITSSQFVRETNPRFRRYVGDGHVGAIPTAAEGDSYGNTDDNKIIVHCEQLMILIQIGSDNKVKSCNFSERLMTEKHQQQQLEKWSQVASSTIRPPSVTIFLDFVEICLFLEKDSVMDTWELSSMFQGIAPGTMWCGQGQLAKDLTHLGVSSTVDRCCRVHDLCPLQLQPLVPYKGTLITGPKTLSHCECDLRFAECLRKGDTTSSRAIFHMYFNVFYRAGACAASRVSTKSRSFSNVFKSLFTYVMKNGWESGAIEKEKEEDEALYHSVFVTEEELPVNEGKYGIPETAEAESSITEKEPHLHEAPLSEEYFIDTAEYTNLETNPEEYDIEEETEEQYHFTKNTEKPKPPAEKEEEYIVLIPENIQMQEYLGAEFETEILTEETREEYIPPERSVGGELLRSETTESPLQLGSVTDDYSVTDKKTEDGEGTFLVTDHGEGFGFPEDRLPGLHTNNYNPYEYKSETHFKSMFSRAEINIKTSVIIESTEISQTFDSMIVFPSSQEGTDVKLTVVPEATTKVSTATDITTGLLSSTPPYTVNPNLTREKMTQKLFASENRWQSPASSASNLELVYNNGMTNQMLKVNASSYQVHSANERNSKEISSGETQRETGDTVVLPGQFLETSNKTEKTMNETVDNATTVKATNFERYSSVLESSIQDPVTWETSAKTSATELSYSVLGVSFVIEHQSQTSSVSEGTSEAFSSSPRNTRIRYSKGKHNQTIAVEIVSNETLYTKDINKEKQLNEASHKTRAGIDASAISLFKTKEGGYLPLEITTSYRAKSAENIEGIVSTSSIIEASGKSSSVSETTAEIFSATRLPYTTDMSVTIEQKTQTVSSSESRKETFTLGENSTQVHYKNDTSDHTHKVHKSTNKTQYINESIIQIESSERKDKTTAQIDLGLADQSGTMVANLKSKGGEIPEFQPLQRSWNAQTSEGVRAIEREGISETTAGEEEFKGRKCEVDSAMSSKIDKTYFPDSGDYIPATNKYEEIEIPYDNENIDLTQLLGDDLYPNPWNGNDDLKISFENVKQTETFEDIDLQKKLLDKDLRGLSSMPSNNGQFHRIKRDIGIPKEERKEKQSSADESTAQENEEIFAAEQWYPGDFDIVRFKNFFELIGGFTDD